MAGCRKDPRSPRVGKDGWDKGAESFFSPPNKDLIPFPIFSMIPPPCPFCVSPSFFFNSAFSRWSRSSSDSPPKNLRAVCAGRRLFCTGVDFGSKGRWGSDVTSEVRDTDGVPTITVSGVSLVPHMRLVSPLFLARGDGTEGGARLPQVFLAVFALIVERPRLGSRVVLCRCAAGALVFHLLLLLHSSFDFVPTGAILLTSCPQEPFFWLRTNGFVRAKGSKETKETMHTNAIVPLKLFKREGLRTMASYGFRSIRVLGSEMGTSWWSWWGF